MQDILYEHILKLLFVLIEKKTAICTFSTVMIYDEVHACSSKVVALEYK